jgi:hypothetical protein
MPGAVVSGFGGEVLGLRRRAEVGGGGTRRDCGDCGLGAGEVSGVRRRAEVGGGERIWWRRFRRAQVGGGGRGVLGGGGGLQMDLNY